MPVLRLSGHRHESNWCHIARAGLAVRLLLDHDQVLSERPADRNHQAAPRRELLDQRFRDMIGRRSHDDQIGREQLGPMAAYGMTSERMDAIAHLVSAREGGIVDRVVANGQFVRQDGVRHVIPLAPTI